jgi:hypothetical protein
MAFNTILFRLAGPAAIASLAACGSAPLDFSGYPDKAHERLYSDGRLGGDKGVADFDLRKAWQAAVDSAH